VVAHQSGPGAGAAEGVSGTAADRGPVALAGRGRATAPVVDRQLISPEQAHAERAPLREMMLGHAAS